VATLTQTAADRGRVVLRLPRLGSGTHLLTASVVGTSLLSAATSKARLLHVT
jgi:hypothetical protein